MRLRLAMAAMAAFAAAASPGLALAQAPLPPHQDPSRVSAEFQPIVLLAYLSEAIDLLRRGQGTSAQKLLSMVESANIPADLRFAIRRYAELLRELGEAMDVARTEMAAASAAIKAGDRETAAGRLEAATATLEQARLQLHQLQEATDALARRVGASFAPKDSPLDRAYRRLLLLLDEMGAIRAGYLLLLEQMREGRVPEEPISVKATLSPNAPEQGYPGREITLSGSLQGVETATALWRITLDGAAIDEFEGPASFQRTILLPVEIQEGTHALGLVFPAQGPYEEAEAERVLRVVRAQPAIALTVGGPLLAGRLRVSGTVASSLGPAAGAAVTVALGGRSATARTDARGAFDASLEVPLLAWTMGPQTVRVAVVPAEPWHSPARTEVRVFLFSVAAAGLAAPVLGYVGGVLGLAWLRRRPEGPPEPLEPRAGGLPAVREPGLAPTAPLLAPGWAGANRLRVIAAYLRAASLLAARRAIRLLPSLTLRDILRAVGAGRGSPFTELTSLAERALYRPPEPEEPEAQRAEELARRAGEEG